MISDVVLVAIIAAVPATVGAVLGFVNRRSIGVVHTVVNGGLKAVKDELAESQAVVLALRQELSALKKRRAK